MRITLNKTQLDTIANQTIKALEKENKQLKSQVAKLNQKVAAYQGGMDLSKEMRTKIKSIAQEMLYALDEARWINVWDDFQE